MIDPYFVDTRERLNLLDNQKALPIWELAESMNIEILKIPANFTHLLSPLDLAVNKIIIEDTSTDIVF